jgi:hypothetical protein
LLRLFFADVGELQVMLFLPSIIILMQIIIHHIHHLIAVGR